VGSASGADDVGAGLTCELGYHRTDCAGRAATRAAPSCSLPGQACPGRERGRWPVRLAGDAHDAAHALRDQVEAAALITVAPVGISPDSDHWR
jgi:hypothetical protein